MIIILELQIWFGFPPSYLIGDIPLSTCDVPRDKKKIPQIFGVIILSPNIYCHTQARCVIRFWKGQCHTFYDNSKLFFLVFRILWRRQYSHMHAHAHKKELQTTLSPDGGMPKRSWRLCMRTKKIVGIIIKRMTQEFFFWQKNDFP